MSVWLIILAFAVVKIPLAALLLWMPFRSDPAADDEDEHDGGERSDGDDGGAKAPRVPPRSPRPRGPRHWRRKGRLRGSHGSPFSPSRVRIGAAWRLRRRTPPRVPAR